MVGWLVVVFCFFFPPIQWNGEYLDNTFRYGCPTAFCQQQETEETTNLLLWPSPSNLRSAKKTTKCIVLCLV